MARPVGAVHRQGAGSPELLAFVAGLIVEEGPALRRIRVNSAEQGLPPISIGPAEGQILDFLVRTCGAKKGVEVGTLGGYSAAWIARALGEGGRLHSFEFDPRHARLAGENLSRAGLGDRVTIRVGAAAETLPSIERHGPFDFCFIDADKINYPAYLRWAAANLRPGGVVVGDNAYLFGKLHLSPGQAGADAASARAMRSFLKTLADPKLFASRAMIPTGEGMAVAVRR